MKSNFVIFKFPSSSLKIKVNDKSYLNDDKQPHVNFLIRHT